jgi:GNAT superfamily N-acetyltransferase
LLRFLEYTSARREAVIALWNRTFRAMRNFLPFDRASWRNRIEELVVPADTGALAGAGPTRFDPRLFRLALDRDDVVGFAHGGTWEDVFLARLLPQGRRARVGTLLVIAVDPSRRRRGVARALLADLAGALERIHGVTGELCADGRGYNPFYGNFLAPAPPPWGTPEGIALPAADQGSRAFFRSAGFREEAEAVTRVRSLAAPPRFAREVPEGFIIEEVENWQPILGTDDGAPFPLPNRSRTWVMREGDSQRAALVAFPFSAERWGIHSFEVEAARRGEGLGRLLLEYALAAVARRGAREIEALAHPTESPEGDHLYERLDFAAAEHWVALG